MYYYMNGTAAHVSPGLAVIDCAGVGYMLQTSLSTSSALRQGDKALLYTYLHVREDALELFGFHSLEERNCFKMLIGISGVGPKAALSVLSAATPERFALSVLTGDEKALTSAQGVGKKLAQRIILELKDKIGREQASSPSGGALSAGLAQDGMMDAISALMVLGYTQGEAAMALRSEDETLPTEELVRRALKKLAASLK